MGYDLRALGPRSATFWSILVQAKRLAYADLLKYNGDPRFVDVPVQQADLEVVRGVAVRPDQPHPCAAAR